MRSGVMRRWRWRSVSATATRWWRWPSRIPIGIASAWTSTSPASAPGFGALALACEREEIDNVRVLDAEASAFLGQLPAASVHRIHVFFPDPWPKKRHRKRRLVNATFAARAASCLEPCGCLALATDWQDYAEQMLDVLNAEAALRGGASARSSARPITPFEAKALAQGRNIVELTYRRVARDERSTPSAGEGSPPARSSAP